MRCSFKVPLLGEYLRRSGISLWRLYGPAALEAALKRLQQGQTVMIFPRATSARQADFPPRGVAVWRC